MGVFRQRFRQPLWILPPILVALCGESYVFEGHVRRQFLIVDKDEI